MNDSPVPVIEGLQFSDSIVNFMPAFIKAQRKMDAVIKGSKASVPTKTGGKYEYTYAKLEDVIDVVKPALLEEGIAYVQNPYNTPAGISVQTVFIHESGESMSGVLTLKPESLAAQQVGSVISYARRYALLAMAGLAAEDDDGKAASSKGKSKVDAPPATTNSDLIQKLADRATNSGLIPDATPLELKQWATSKLKVKWNAASLPAIEEAIAEHERLMREAAE